MSLPCFFDPYASEPGGSVPAATVTVKSAPITVAVSHVTFGGAQTLYNDPTAVKGQKGTFSAGSQIQPVWDASAGTTKPQSPIWFVENSQATVTASFTLTLAANYAIPNGYQVHVDGKGSDGFAVSAFGTINGDNVSISGVTANRFVEQYPC